MNIDETDGIVRDVSNLLFKIRCMLIRFLGYKIRGYLIKLVNDYVILKSDFSGILGVVDDNGKCDNEVGIGKDNGKRILGVTDLV